MVSVDVAEVCCVSVFVVCLTGDSCDDVDLALLTMFGCDLVGVVRAGAVCGRVITLRVSGLDGRGDDEATTSSVRLVRPLDTSEEAGRLPGGGSRAWKR